MFNFIDCKTGFVPDQGGAITYCQTSRILKAKTDFNSTKPV